MTSPTSFEIQFLTREPSANVAALSSSDPFVDQATTHTLSDWLLALSYDFGYEPDESFPLGALPDLAPVVERKAGHTVINKQKLKVKQILPLGEILNEYVPGKFFIDLGCGNLETSVAPQILAEIFAAKTYVGVDRFHASSIKMDLLEFLARLECDQPKIFFLGGIDPKDDLFMEYVRQMRVEFNRVCQSGDLIILGAGTTSIGLEEDKNFHPIYRDSFHDIYEFT
jgi:hypothetical protein